MSGIHRMSRDSKTVMKPVVLPAQQRLADGLKRLQELQAGGARVYQGAEFERRQREALENAGFLRRVMRGWYIAAGPGEGPGDTTAWNASFRDFIGRYCTTRFGDRWYLSPEISILVHAGVTVLPRQVFVMAKGGRRNVVELLGGNSIFDNQPVEWPDEQHLEQVGPLRVLSLPFAFVRVSDVFFRTYAADAYIALRLFRDASALLRILTEKRHSHIAGRLVGAFRAAHLPRIAQDISGTMKAAGFHVTEANPFPTELPRLGGQRPLSPYVDRIRIMWETMRPTILENVPAEPGRPSDVATYLAAVVEAYRADAYHSLSIEGYTVTDDLIARVSSGNWNPDGNASDTEAKNAMAARGYFLAHTAIRESLKRILAGENPGTVTDQDHGEWYRQLFSPSLAAGLVTVGDLSGYRNGQVYIRNADHVPPEKTAVPDMMFTLFELLTEETSAAVRAVLGHFIFVFIHPYMDGNGRMGRFLMNAMLASGGYPWTVIPVERRTEYMAALNAASARADIGPFARFIASCIGAKSSTPA